MGIILDTEVCLNPKFNIKNFIPAVAKFLLAHCWHSCEWCLVL